MSRLLGFCEFCETHHSSLSCFHPGKRRLSESEAEIKTLKSKLAQQAKRIEMLEKIREAAIWTLEEYQRSERKGYEAKISEDLAELLTKTLEAYAAKYEDGNKA